MRLLILFTSIFLTTAVCAQDLSVTRLALGQIDNSRKTDQVGFGIQAGSLTGVNVEYWLNESRALNGSVTSDSGNTAIGISHQWFARNVLTGPLRDIAPYVGAGLIAAFGRRPDIFLRGDEDFAFAAQVPLGLEYLPVNQRFSIFSELAPSLEVRPVTAGRLTGDIGARLYF